MQADRGAPHPDTDTLREKYLAERDKRLHAERSAQYLDASGELGHFADDPYVEPGFTRAPVAEEVDVAVVGGGFGGLLTAAQLVDRGVTSFRIIEQAGDFGGTWYWNRYPGVRCDIESYCYLPLLEEIGAMPSERYAHGTEIFAHCQAIGRHYGLYDHALFQTRVTRIAWDAAAARWILSTDRGDRIAARFVTVSQGPLAKVKLPGIPGIRDFKGRMFHSARWDYAYTGGDATGGQTALSDKSVAVIGTGATAVQIVPRLADHAERLYLFQRTPSAIDERNNHPTDPEWYRSQPPGWQRRRMHNFLSIISGLPTEEDIVGDRWTDFWHRFGALMTERARTGDATPPPALFQQADYAKMEDIRARVSEIVSDPARAEALKPWYNYLCKRPLYSDEFLQAFNRPNVHLIDTEGRGVEAITADSVVANGHAHRVDCIIFATGFDVGAAPYTVGGYQVIGRAGRSLEARWEAGVRSVHGMQAAEFPNFFIVGATLQGTTAFNFTHTLAMQAEHATSLIQRFLSSGVTVAEVTPEAEDRWLAQLEAKHVDHQQFYEDCTPGFLNNEGDFRDRPTFVGGSYGGGPIEYEQVITAWRESAVEADMTLDRNPPAAAFPDAA